MTRSALVIGAGPAGLMAAEELASAGLQVRIAEAKPSPARKFLMAGKSGLNLSMDEPLADFIPRYAEAADWLGPMLHDFGPAEVKQWAEGLGQPVFTGSTGRVFPVAMKGSPLLRAWMARLQERGVQLHTRWRWTGLAGRDFLFDTPDGPQQVTPDVCVLALGGASWSRLGSDGAWTGILGPLGVDLAPFATSNAGLLMDWSDHMTRHFGTPLKGARLSAGDLSGRGEIVISARGLEGGGLYPLTPALRKGADLVLDLFPALDEETLATRLSARGKETLGNRLRKAGVGPAAAALLNECARPLPTAPRDLAALLKALHIRHRGTRPIDEAISVAGGITRTALDDGLQLRALPRIFAAGEMLDWEAPTGGYLLTACLATGRHAGRAAAALAAA